MKTKTNDVKELANKNDVFGINGLVVVVIGIVGNLVIRGGLLTDLIGSVCALVAPYYLISRRKTLEKKQKYIGWGLVILWVIILGITGQTQA